jgi:hypothetical protein
MRWCGVCDDHVNGIYIYYKKESFICVKTMFLAQTIQKIKIKKKKKEKNESSFTPANALRSSHF